MIDIGGGSTELVCGAGGELGFHVSTQIGVVRHTERHLASDPPAAQELAALAADVDAGIAAIVPDEVRARVRRPPSRSPGPRRRARRSTSSSSATTPRRSRATCSRARGSTRCSTGSPRCRSPSAATVRGLHPDRAPTIVAGVVVLSRVLDAFGLAEVEVSDRDILWGVAIEIGR